MCVQFQAAEAKRTDLKLGEAMKKRRTAMQAMFESVEVKSLANGDLRVTPVWRGYKPWTPEDGGGPGVITRMAGAARLQRFLNAHLRQALNTDK